MNFHPGRNGRRVCWQFEFFVFLHLGTLLQFIVIDYVLIGWRRLDKGVQLVHVEHILPQVFQRHWNFEVAEIFSCDANVLQPGHEFAIETAHSIPRKEAGGFPSKMCINFFSSAKAKRSLKSRPV